MSTYKVVNPGDLVLNKMKTWQGSLGISDHLGIVSPAYIVCELCGSFDRRFIHYLLRSRPYVHRYNQRSFGVRVNQWDMRYDDFRRILVVLPPIEEQQAIARFLDHYDRLTRRYIRAQRRLIELLEEQEQALIQRAVTRGLDASVPLKDSGIEWLGEIPAHWEVMALRYRYTVELGKMLDAKQITGKHLVPYLRNVDVQWDCINTESLPEMDIKLEEYARYTLQTGDLLVCEGGEVGRCAFWTGDLPLCGYQKALHRLRPRNPSLDTPRFLYYLMYVVAHRGIFLADGSENTIAHLTGEKLRRHRFAFPPVDEQSSIAARLDVLVNNIDDAAQRTQRQIDLIREYRTRLIADVVTGKLDVRDVSLPDLDADDEPGDFDDLERGLSGPEEETDD